MRRYTLQLSLFSLTILAILRLLTLVLILLILCPNGQNSNGAQEKRRT
jgi:hypothetical protein